MSEHPLPLPFGSEPIDVNATVSRWRVTSQNHPFGFAAFTVDGVSYEAYCNRFMDGIELPLDTPFACAVAVVKGRLKVTSIPATATEEIAGFTGMVVLETHGGKSLLGQHMGMLLRPGLPLSALPKSIHSIAEGAQVEATVRRQGNGFTVAQVHSPTARDAVPALRSDKLTHELIAYVSGDWAEGAKTGARCFFREHPGAPVFGAAFLNDNLLRPAGIGRLYRATDTERDGEHSQVATWDRILKSGSREAVAELRIDRVLVEVEWLAHSGQWRVQRLIAPRAVRAPDEEGEYVDWVDARVLEVKLAQSQLPPKKGDKPDPSYELKVHFRHDGVGQFDARYWTRQSFLERDGLAVGTVLTVRLKAKGGYWNINRIHRSTPLRPAA